MAYILHFLWSTLPSELEFYFKFGYIHWNQNRKGVLPICHFHIFRREHPQFPNCQIHFQKHENQKSHHFERVPGIFFLHIRTIIHWGLKLHFGQKIILITLVALYAYFNGYYQGKVTGFGSACGLLSIQGYSVGISISGIGANIIAIIFALIFNSADQGNLETSLKNQMISYLICLPLVFTCYIIVLCLFFKRFGHYVDLFDQELNAKEEPLLVKTTKSDRMSVKTMKTFASWKTVGSERKYSGLSIMKRIMDMWMAMIFTYYFSIQSLTFMIPTLADKYDNNDQMYILVYILLYNIGDTLGRLFPHSWNFKSTFAVHLITILRCLVQIYFIFLIFTSVPKFLSHFVFRGVVYLLIGVSNGFLTNNYFYISPLRFRNIKNQDYSGFLMVLALFVGIACGTFSGVLWGL